MRSPCNIFCKRRLNIDDLVVPNAFIGVFSERELNRYKLIFAHIDADGNGTIDAEEFTAVLKKFRIDASKEKIAEMFEEASGTGSNGVDFGGFLEEMTKKKRQRAGLKNAFAELAVKVGKQNAVKVEGDCCFVPNHSSGSLVKITNVLGILFCIYWTYVIAFIGPDEVSFLRVFYEAINSLKLGGNWNEESTRQKLGARLELLCDLAAPLLFLFVFAMPLTCCTSGPFEYLQVRSIQGITGGLVFALCGLEAIAEKDVNLELPFLIAYVLVILTFTSVLALRTAAEHFRLEYNNGGTDDDDGDHYLFAARTPMSRKIRKYRMLAEIKMSQWKEQWNASRKNDEEEDEDTRVQWRTRRLAAKNATELTDLESGRRMQSPGRMTSELKNKENPSGAEVAAAIAANLANWRQKNTLEELKIADESKTDTGVESSTEPTHSSINEHAQNISEISDKPVAKTKSSSSLQSTSKSGNYPAAAAAAQSSSSSSLSSSSSSSSSVNTSTSALVSNKQTSPESPYMMSPLGASAVRRAELLLSRSRPSAGVAL
mmetsp:Transcript_32025/g.65214  ORF Transcript_32025/g.65214 Transcript_32025/m.65214 type:complete len:544 (+) Transcript_32025:85-1716(+)